MNRYTHDFLVKCPNNDLLVAYRLVITTPRVIMVEDIVAACKVESAYHEALADQLYQRFGGRQVMTAHHHGVDIETTRGRA